MAESCSGVRWPAWPLAGAVGAGRSDELTAPSEQFTLTPTGLAEQQRAAGTAEEVPGEGPE